VRIYVDALEMIKEVERDLFEMGTNVQSHTVQDRDVHDDPNFRTIELFGYGYTLLNLDETNLHRMMDHTKTNYAWALSESVDRVQPTLINPGGTYLMDEGLWAKYVRKDGRFAYTYNERIRTQLERTIQELRAKPRTRQAVITVYDKSDMSNWGGVDRVPCSMHYQFAERGGKLNVIYVMRSCDFLKHFASDVYFASALLRHVAVQTGMQVGALHHFLGSLHAFKGDMDRRGIF
jgi:thymidylate synthase